MEIPQTHPSQNLPLGGAVLCRLMVPKNNEKTPEAAALMFAALHGIYNYNSRIQPVISFEIVSINKFIQFYFYAPRHLKNFIEGQLYAQYPNVEISEAEDYAGKVLAGKYAIGLDLKTTRDDVYPIRTFQNFEADPLSGITSILSQVKPEEELWIQVCISPIGDSWQKKALGYVNAIKSGRDPNEPLWKSLARGVFGIARHVATTPTASVPAPAKEAPTISGPEAEALKGIEQKTTKLGFLSKIRILSLAKDRISAQHNLNSLVGGFKQYSTGNMNGFIHAKPVEGEPIINLYQLRALGPRPYIFNVEELASIFHLPGESVETPAMDWAGSRKGEPPQNLPLVGEVPAEDFSVLGLTNFRSVEKKFGIKINDRALHIYAIGKTGTGKSTLLGNMIIDDIHKGRGVGVVDPHGDLIRDVMDYIPDDRLEDVVYFSPADREFPIGFNILENVDPEYKNIVASGIVGVFKKIFGESWGPRLEYILRNVVLGLLDYPGATMLSIIKILTDTKFRRSVIEKISDPVIRDFFLNEFERYDQKFRTEAVAPIQNKVGQFLSSTVIRNIVGQLHSTIDVREIMDKKKILLLDLSIGKIGEDNSALLGSLLITKIQMAALSRADLPKDKRVPFYFYVDEFQNFATDSFAIILSEARKYGLSLMVTNQYIAQMPETVSNAVFGNVGSIICFRVGAGDAEALQREFVPVFETADLTNLNNFSVYIKMAIDGVTSTPFSGRTTLTEYKETGNMEKVIRQSRDKYSKPRTEVEEYIAEETTKTLSPLEVSREVGIKKGEDREKKEEKEGSIAEIQEDLRPLEEDSAPSELANAKMAEDYDTNRWYFLTRTGYRKLTGREIPEDEEDETKMPEGKKKTTALERIEAG